MRKMLLTSVAMASLALAPAAFAQTNGATQNPPSPNASSQMPQPMNSAPVGAAVPARQANPVGSLGAPVATGPAPTTSAAVAMPMKKRVHVARIVKRDAAVQDVAVTDASAPPTSAYRGGAGSPLSTQATDLTPARGEKMGSRLPMPPTTGDTPKDFLAAAQTALNKGQTGAAQQALEMAETRVLSRTTDPSLASQPDQQSMVANIGAARHALGSHDIAAAKKAVAMALNDRVPGPGPAVVTGPAGLPATMTRTN